MPPRRDLGHARSLGGHRRRVRHLGLCAVQCEAQKGPNLDSTSSANSRDRPLILLVYRQDIVESLAVVRSEPASPLSAYVETPQTWAPLCHSSGGCPTCQEPVPAEFTKTSCSSPSRLGTCSKTPCASGERPYIIHADEQCAYHRYGIYHPRLVE